MAVRAGMTIVMRFAKTRTELLLPALEQGLHSHNYRIRLSSVQLLGCLILKVCARVCDCLCVRLYVCVCTCVCVLCMCVYMFFLRIVYPRAVQFVMTAEMFLHTHEILSY